MLNLFKPPTFISNKCWNEIKGRKKTVHFLVFLFIAIHISISKPYSLKNYACLEGEGSLHNYIQKLKNKIKYNNHHECVSDIRVIQEMTTMKKKQHNEVFSFLRVIIWICCYKVKVIQDFWWLLSIVFRTFIFLFFFFLKLIIINLKHNNNFAMIIVVVILSTRQDNHKCVLIIKKLALFSVLCKINSFILYFETIIVIYISLRFLKIKKKIIFCHYFVTKTESYHAWVKKNCNNQL